MDKPHIRESHGGEWHIQQKLIRYLQARGWLVEVTQGNLYQVGFPDLYLAHSKHGQRWVDVKNPVSYNFTKAQRRKWPIWDSHGVGIWILVAPTEEEYDKLWGTPNWRTYWKSKWDEEPTVDELLGEMNQDWEPL